MDLMEEFDEECEKHTREFLRNRQLFDLQSIQNRHKKEHDTRLKKRLKRVENPLIQYRFTPKNIIAGCDSQFQKNLHYLCGDGSNVGDRSDRHYAMDRYFENCAISKEEEINLYFLKNIPKQDKKVFIKNWISQTRSHSGLDFTRRRNNSFGQLNLKIELAEKDEPEAEKPRYHEAWYHSNDSLHNVDPKYKLPTGEDAVYISRKITCGLEKAAWRLDPKKYELGWIHFSKIILTTNDCYGYAIDARHDKDQSLINFCENFHYWMRKKAFLKSSKDQWNRKLVVLYQEKYESEHTEYRRAIHIGEIRNIDHFIEIDTGDIVSLPVTSIGTVLVLPTVFALYPPAFFEFRIKNIETVSQMKEQIAEFRKWKMMKIIDYVYQERTPIVRHGQEPLPRSNIKSFVIDEARDFPKRYATRLFCDEVDCTMCSVEHFLP